MVGHFKHADQTHLGMAGFLEAAHRVLGMVSFTACVGKQLDRIDIGVGVGNTARHQRTGVGLFSPEDRSAEFFGLWGLFAKVGAAFGPLTFGLLADAAGLRVATYSLAVFFVVGLVGMRFVDEEEGIRAADSESA